MDINGRVPKELVYIQKFQNHFSQGRLYKLKSKIISRDEEYSKSDLAEFITHKNDDYVYQFMDKLIEDGVLKHAGKREKQNSSDVDLYTYQGNKALLKAFSDSDFYQEIKPLFIDTLEKAEGEINL